MKKKLSRESTKSLGYAKDNAKEAIKTEATPNTPSSKDSLGSSGTVLKSTSFENFTTQTTQTTQTTGSDESFSTADIANGQSLVPGMGRRMLAYMIDFSIATVLGTGLLMGILWATTGSQFAARLANLISVFLFCSVINAVHHIYFESHPKWRATLGKVLMGMSIIDANAQTISRSVAIRRFLWRIPSVLSVGFFYLLSGMGNYGLAIHDRKTATITVVRNIPIARMQSGLRAGREFTRADKACLFGGALLLCNATYNLIQVIF